MERFNDFIIHLIVVLLWIWLGAAFINYANAKPVEGRKYVLCKVAYEDNKGTYLTVFRVEKQHKNYYYVRSDGNLLKENPTRTYATLHKVKKSACKRVNNESR